MPCVRVEVPEGIRDGRFREVNDQVIAEYRANGGRLETAFADTPILLLTHRGAKTGTPYTSPLAFTRHGDDFAVIASMGGAPVDPPVVPQPARPPRRHHRGRRRHDPRASVGHDRRRARPPVPGASRPDVQLRPLPDAHDPRAAGRPARTALRHELKPGRAAATPGQSRRPRLGTAVIRARGRSRSGP